MKQTIRDPTKCPCGGTIDDDGVQMQEITDPKYLMVGYTQWECKNCGSTRHVKITSESDSKSEAT